MKQFHSVATQTLVATVQILVATTTWSPRYVHPWTSPYYHLLPFVSFRKLGFPVNCVESFSFRIYNIPVLSSSLYSVVDFITKMLSVVRFLFTTPD